MQPVKPIVTETPGHIVQAVDLLKTISNVVTVMVYGNARPGMSLALDSDILARWRHTALRAANTSDLPEILETLRMDSNASRSPQRYFLQKYAEIAAVLMTSPAYMPDVGHNLAQELLRGGGHWSKSWVSSPSLGYARPYLSLECQVNAGLQPIGLPAWDLEETELTFGPEKNSSKQRQATSVALPGDGIDAMPNTFRHAIASLAMLLDRPAMSDSLIPDASSLTSRDAKEQHWGMRGAVEQTNRFTSIGLLYLVQADVFWTRFTEPLFNAAYDVAFALNPRDRAVLEFKKKLRQELVRMVPLHPVLESIVNLFGKTEVSTRFGTKPLAFRHGPTEEQPAGAQSSSAMLSVGSLRSMLAQQIVADAITDYSRLRELATTQTWPSDLLAAVAPTLGNNGIASLLGLTPKGANPYRSHGEVVEWLARNDRYVKLWPEVARMLGWGGAIGAPNITIEAGGADFVLSDGDFYSHTPLSVLAGLRPSISVANKKAMGLAVRFEEHFNTGPAADAVTLKDNRSEAPVKIKWSTVTFTGHMSATKGAVSLTKFYMPPGMQMGEQGGETRFIADGTTDPLALEIVDFYKALSPTGYIRHWYGDPESRVSRLDDGVLYMRTSWDAWTENTDKDKTQEVLITKYGDKNTESLDIFIFRDSWNMRAPVQLARTYELELYNELGELRVVFPYDGHLMFNDSLELGDSVSGVDGFVDLLRVRAPELATPYTGEVTPPESAG